MWYVVPSMTPKKLWVLLGIYFLGGYFITCSAEGSAKPKEVDQGLADFKHLRLHAPFRDSARNLLKTLFGQEKFQSNLKEWFQKIAAGKPKELSEEIKKKRFGWANKLQDGEKDKTSQWARDYPSVLQQLIKNEDFQTEATRFLDEILMNTEVQEAAQKAFKAMSVTIQSASSKRKGRAKDSNIELTKGSVEYDPS